MALNQNYTLSPTGIRIDLLHPLPEMFNILDISHTLGNINRFNGNLPQPYTVAQHSVHVSRLVPKEFALGALLHDASEAICCDIPTPLKRLLPHSGSALEALLEQVSLSGEIPGPEKAILEHLLSKPAIASAVRKASIGYADIEERIQGAIHEAFGLPASLSEAAVAAIKRADLIALATEKRDLMWVDDGAWEVLEGVAPDAQAIIPLASPAATMLFRNRFYEITKPGQLQHLAA